MPGWTISIGFEASDVESTTVYFLLTDLMTKVLGDKLVGTALTKLEVEEVDSEDISLVRER